MRKKDGGLTVRVGIHAARSGPAAPVAGAADIRSNNYLMREGEPEIQQELTQQEGP